MSRYQRELDRLDEAAWLQHRLDAAIRLGRIEGELAGMRKMMGNEHKYDRTPESRLEKHLLRQWDRLKRRWDAGLPFPEQSSR